MSKSNKTRTSHRILTLSTLLIVTTLSLSGCGLSKSESSSLIRGAKDTFQIAKNHLNKNSKSNNDTNNTDNSTNNNTNTATDLTSLANAAIEVLPDKTDFKKYSYEYQNGVFVVNNNQATINFKNTRRAYVQLSDDSLKRPTLAVAVLNKSTRQYQNRQSTNNGAGDFKPLGYQQLKLTNSSYQWAYNRGHLIGYALAGNLASFDASESNPKNIITQTSWANQSQNPTSRGQNYYEGLVRQALDRNKIVEYSVKPLYYQDELVARAVWIQAKSTDNSLNFNVVVPNVQENLQIDYQTGKAIEK